MKIKNKEKYIFLIMYLAYVSIYAARVNLSVASPQLTDMNILDAAKIGFLGSVFSTIYAFGRVVNGRISDTAPPWKMLVFGLAAAGISNMLISIFPPYIGIFLLWSINAYAQSMLWSSILYVVTFLYDKDKVKNKTSLMVTSVATGNVVGIVLNTFFITKLGVKYAFLIPGGITLILGGITFVMIRHIPNTGKDKQSRQSFFEILKTGELAKLIIPAVFHGVMKENISLWMTVYIIDKYAVDLSTSSYYVLLIPIIGFFGRIIYPAVLKMCRNDEISVTSFGFAVCTVAAVVLCMGNVGILASVIMLSVIYAAVSVINTSFLSIYPLRYAKTGNTASVSGIMDFATYLGAGVSSAIYGIVIKNFGYLPMFVSWAAISAVSIIITNSKLNKTQICN